VQERDGLQGILEGLISLASAVTQIRPLMVT